MRHGWLVLIALSFYASAAPEFEPYSLVTFEAQTREQRSRIANAGVALERLDENRYGAYLTDSELQRLKKLGFKFKKSDLQILDFPAEDAAFHNFAELEAELQKLQRENPDIVALESLGPSRESRPLYWLRISTNPRDSSTKPGIAFVGGHHAREHLSVEMPLQLAQHLVKAYREGHEPEVTWIRTREIHIVPLLNPDGAEFDVFNNDYHFWRKNRRPNNPTGRVGVDLNRNYAWGWGGEGSSGEPGSDVYRGPSAFSEPESQAIKKLIEEHSNISILLSFHTFSQLILYPWGGSTQRIPERDYLVHKTMAEKMAEWNGYTPEQSSDLYVATGDATDWTYGAHGVISFTFEMDPTSWGEGGFYPGADFIERVVSKNIQPCLYLMGFADNPYRVLEPHSF